MDFCANNGALNRVNIALEKLLASQATNGHTMHAEHNVASFCLLCFVTVLAISVADPEPQRTAMVWARQTGWVRLTLVDLTARKIHCG